MNATLLDDRFRTSKRLEHCRWCEEMIAAGHRHVTARLSSEDGPEDACYHVECFMMADFNAPAHAHKRGSRDLIVATGAHPLTAHKD